MNINNLTFDEKRKIIYIYIEQYFNLDIVSRELLNSEKIKKFENFIKKNNLDKTYYTTLLIENIKNKLDLEVVKYLVENGADIKARDNYVVRWALYSGHLKVVKYLVKNGAEDLIKTKNIISEFNQLF